MVQVRCLDMNEWQRCRLVAGRRFTKVRKPDDDTQAARERRGGGNESL